MAHSGVSLCHIEPDIHIEPSKHCAKGLHPEILAKAREGAGTFVYYIIPNARRAVRMGELYIREVGVVDHGLIVA